MKKILILIIVLLSLITNTRSQNSTVLYENNFDSYTSRFIPNGWTIQNNSATVTFNNGSMQIYGSGTTGGMVLYNKVLPSNYSIEYDLTLISLVYTADNTRWTSTVINYNDGVGFWNVGLRKNGNGGIDKYSFTTSSWSANTFSGSGALNYGQSYKIKVVVKDNAISYYVDGVLKRTAVTIGSEYATGKVGISVRDMVVNIDNFKISSLSATDEPTTIYENNYNNFGSNGSVVPENWTVRYGTARVAYVNGAMQLESSNMGILLYNGTLPTNCIVEYDYAVKANANATFWGGTILRYNEDLGFYNAGIKFNGSKALEKYNNTTNTWTSTAIAGTESLVLNKYYHIKVVVENMNLSYYVDGVLIGTKAMDTGYESGKIGIALKGQTVCIDNFSVKSIDNTSTLYENNFNSYASLNLSDDWEARNYSANIDYTDNCMRISNTISDNTPGIVLLNDTMSGDNYVVEFDYTMESSFNDTRWGGMVYRLNDGLGYWVSSIRKNGNAALDNFNFVSNNWPNTNPFTRDTPIELNKSYHIKIIVFGMRVSMYLDGNFIGNITLPDGYEHGRLGFVCSNSTIKIDNLVIKEATLADDGFYLAAIYKPTTKIANAPVVISKITKLSDYNALNNNVRPAVTIVEIDDNLNVTDENSTILSTASKLISTYGKNVIPAFYLKNLTQARNLANLLKSMNILDAFVLSDDSTAYLVKEARAICKTIRGIIRFNDAIDSPSKGAAVIDSLNINYANVAIIPANSNDESILYLQSRLAMVWLSANESNEIYSAIVKGANGIISGNYTKIFDIYSSFDAPTLIRKPLITGHRGSASTYPENTMGSFVRAVDDHADFIEMDVYLSADSQIVVIHDNTVDRTTNGSGKVETFTLAQLKSLDVDQIAGITEKIPTLEEVFIYAKTKNVIIQLEIKSTKPLLITKLASLIKKYDFYNQIVIFSFSTSQLALVRELLPSVPAGQFISATSTDENMITLIRNLSVYNYNLSPGFGSVVDFTNYIYTMAARGLGSWFWTLNNQTKFDELAIKYNATTTASDYPHWGADLNYRLEALPLSPVANKAFFPTANLIGSNANAVTCGMIKIGGNVNMVSSGGGYVFSAAGVDTVMYFKDLTFRSTNYRIYSKPLILTISDVSTSVVKNTSNYDKVFTVGNSLKVKLSEVPQKAELSIYRMDGITVFTDKITTDFEKELSPGIYLVKLTNNGQTNMFKLISENL